MTFIQVNIRKVRRKKESNACERKNFFTYRAETENFTYEQLLR